MLRALLRDYLEGLAENARNVANKGSPIPASKEIQDARSQNSDGIFFSVDCMVSALSLPNETVGKGVGVEILE